MQTIEMLHYCDMEVTPEEEEAWKIFLLKFGNKEIKELIYETTIPRENIDGIFQSSN